MTCSELFYHMYIPLLRKENHIHHGLQKVLNNIKVNPFLLSKYPIWGYFIAALIVT